MKYEYVTVTSKNTIEIDDTWSSVLMELDRQINNTDQRETRRHISMDAYNLDDALLPSGTDIEAEYERKESIATVTRAISRLLPDQQRLVQQIFFEGISSAEIARCEGVDKSAISHRLRRAIKKLEKNLV